MARPKRDIDWEWIEGHWRAGLLSVMQIAAQYKEDTGDPLSHTAIIKHFKQLGITRDLAAKIRAKSDALVSASLVSGLVSAETTKSETQIIDESAEMITHIRLAQRTDITRTRKLVMDLLAELERTTGNMDLFEQLGELMDAPNEDGNAKVSEKRRELYEKVISLAGRTGTMKALSESLKTLVALEREAFGIDDRRTATIRGTDISITF
jgi:hypothetical protein